MAKRYSQQVSHQATPQTRSAKAGQIKNKAGGYVFQVSCWTQLNRFLILGNELGTYYASEEEMTIKNYDCIKKCLAEDWKRTINTIVQISDEGRAPKNTSAIFALAVCSVFGSCEAKAYANKLMPKVARYSTDLFKWVTDVLALKHNKKGKGLLRAIGHWYNEKSAADLAYQICKYPSRSFGDGKKIGHANLLRLARPAPARGNGSSRNGAALTIPSLAHGKVYQYTIHGVINDEGLASRAKEEATLGKKVESPGVHETVVSSWKDSDLKYIWAHEQAKKATKKEMVKLIADYHLTRESVPPEMRNDPDVQRALLVHTPMTALIRNLGSMTASGLLKNLSDETGMVLQKLEDKVALKKARIHPMTLLMAQRVYASGSGMRTKWEPVQSICDALEKAFYDAFNYIEPTGKKFLIASDASGSMFWPQPGCSNLMCAEAAAVIAMVLARTEKQSYLTLFSDRLLDWKVSKTDSLSAVTKKLNISNWGGTDCSLPIKHAMQHSLDVDIFVVLTDNETWAGKSHVFEDLREYRERFNKNAKLAAVAFTATESTLADPSDPGMMDFVGLDSHIPKLLAEFACDKI